MYNNFVIFTIPISPWCQVLMLCLVGVLLGTMEKEEWKIKEKMCGNGVWLEEGEGEKIGRTDYFPSWSTTTSFSQIGEKIRVKMRSKNSLSFWTNNPLILNKKLNQQCFQAPWLFTQPRSRSSLSLFFFFFFSFFLFVSFHIIFF